MDNTEIHYLTYDPDEILKEMLRAYAQAGGEPIYAGDEKEILMQAMLQIMAQAFAGIDNALRMDTLRYAVREYLDIYGEKRSCPRIEARKAAARIKITMRATGNAGVIPQGTALTADGEVLYATTEDVAVSGSAQVLYADVECTRTGTVGNSLTAGTEMQSVVPIAGAGLIVCQESAAGGQDREEDEAYRERIRTWGLTRTGTGPRQQYEAAAKAVSSSITDAKAVNLDGGEVGVYLIFSTDTGKAALIAQVEAALSDESVRPLTDTVTVSEATAVPYTLNVKYAYDGSVTAQSRITAAAAEYQAWQEGAVGRAFNPDKLAAMMYQAGATRVIWDTGSEFDGGAVEYTEIGEDEYCKGTITQAVIS